MDARTEERDCSGGFHTTSLMKGARDGQVELVVRALECTATSLEAVGADGRTALIIAAAAGHAPVVRCLLNAGADLSPADGRGLTAEGAAAESGHAEVCSMLREEHAAREAVWRAATGQRTPLDQLIQGFGGVGMLNASGARESPF